MSRIIDVDCESHPAPVSRAHVSRQAQGTKLLVLNLYQGSHPEEIPLSKTMSSGQILELSVDDDDSMAQSVTLLTNQRYPDGIDVYKDRMYWTCMGVPSHNDGAVYSAELDGSDIRTVVGFGAVHTPKQLHIDQKNEKLYFCDREGLRVHRSNLDGSAHEVLIQTGDWKIENDKVQDQTNWPVGITISHRLGKFFWTQKGPSKSKKGRIFCANIETPVDTNAMTRNDIVLVSDRLPEPIDLDFDDGAGALYWTDRGELPLGNTLNKKTLVGQAPEEEKALGRQIIANGFGEAIGLRIDEERERIYVADLSGRLWECYMHTGPKKKVFEAAGHAYTGIGIVKRSLHEIQPRL